MPLDANRPMDERELLAVLKEEETAAASFYTSELAKFQADAMDRFNARPYGDEVEGRSAVVTHDIEDAINWAMPHIMRLFLQNDELVTVEDDTTDDTSITDMIGEYLTHIFFKDNSGEEVLYDFAFDGFLQRIGVVRVGWEEPQPSPPKRLKGIVADRLQQILDDPEYEILAQSSEMREDGIEEFELEVRHTPKCGRVIIEQVPPEEFAFAEHSKDIESSDYHRRKTEEFVSDLVREFPDKARDLDPDNYSGLAQHDEIDSVDDDPRRTARFHDEENETGGDTNTHKRRRKVDLLTEYIRIDYDGDGVVEYRQIKRVGNTILENIEVEESEYVTWSPIRVSHKLVGRSLTDTLLDFQKIRTVTTRKLLDSLAQSLAPRRIANKNRLGDGGIEQLLDHDIGDVIESDGDPREAVFELVTPDVSGSAYQALEYFDQRAEEASGVTRHAQGLKPQAITDTAKGIENLQAAANARIELIGRWLGHAVEKIFRRVYKLVCAYQDNPRQIKLQGKPISIDPRHWSDTASVTLHIGQAAETREAKLVKLNVLSQKQEQILLQAGPNNPLVSIKEYRETLALMAREMGFKDPGRFFRELPPDYEPQPEQQQPDPKLVEIQGKLKLQEAEAQQKAQLEQAKAQADVTITQQKNTAEQQMQAARVQGDQQIAQMKFEHEARMAELRMQSEQQIAAMRIESEKEIAYARMQSEMELARWKAEREVELGYQRATADAEVKKASMNGKTNRPGGDLDK